jgi:8-oxo-dGTP diphosphatase
MRQIPLVKHFVINLIIVDADKVLLEKRNGQWKLPGGHINDGENPVDAVRREAAEELGIEVDFLAEEQLFVGSPETYSLPTPFSSFVHVVDSDGVLGDRHENTILTYIVEPRGKARGLESQEIAWYSKDELRQARVSQIVKDIALAGLKRYLTSQK